jgi:diguanylate cyclase (GGDEF)-like protein
VLSSLIERFRAFGASVDGTLLDGVTWRNRHRYVLLATWALALFCLVFTLADREMSEQWIYVGVALSAAALAAVPNWPRRVLEMLVAVSLVASQFYGLRYVGNFTLGPLAIIVITFYQDWLPIAFGCVVVSAMVILAGVDPAFYEHTRAFAIEKPVTGMSLRAAAIVLTAGLALAIWRSGTQIGRDQLTGMLSRAGAERALDREIKRGYRPAVWVCDLDNFRAVNHQLGPATGDLLLRSVAGRLRRVARELDGRWLCARLGGDTFLIAGYHSTGVDAVEAFAHRIEAEAGGSVEALAEDEVPVRFSVGAAIAAPGEAAAHMIRAAERNMRAAKGRGTSRVIVDRSNDRPVENSTSLLSSELYRACSEGELLVHLQPVVSLDDGSPVGAEALVRWNHPERGLVWPGEFLPEAEQDSALMAVISRNIGAQFLLIVGDLTRRHGADWLPHGFNVNLAAIRLRDPTLSSGLIADLDRTGLRRTDVRITLEVTEGALMDIEYGVPEVLAGLRNGGYQIALDDFGTGHSSLAHLRDFPLDIVKLDKSFVHAMGHSAIDHAVVQAVADIASASGLKVVAEGVETPAQRDMLLAIKPDILAQGWLYARSMPIDEFEDWVLERKRAAIV